MIRDSTSADADNVTAPKHALQRKHRGTKVGVSVYDTDDTLCNHDDFSSINRYRCDSDVITMSGSEAMTIMVATPVNEILSLAYWHRDRDVPRLNDEMLKLSFLFSLHFFLTCRVCFHCNHWFHYFPERLAPSLKLQHVVSSAWNIYGYSSIDLQQNMTNLCKFWQRIVAEIIKWSDMIKQCICRH